MKNKKVRFLIILFLGFLGIHKFIEKKTTLGWVYLFTGGICGIGWFIDIIMALKDLIPELSESNGSAKNNVSQTNEKVRRSTRKLSFIYDNNKYLRYVYYDVEVEEIEKLGIDLSKIEINHQLYFDEDKEKVDNPNAVKVLYDDKCIGYIPNNNLQSMVMDYGYSDEKEVCGMTYLVDEEKQKLQIALGFYDVMDSRVETLDTKLVKTTKKDEFEDRQDNLFYTTVNDEVELEYDEETETYLVMADGSEIGEVSKKDSQKLQEYEDEGMDFKAYIIEKEENDSDKYECKIRVIIR